MSCQLCDNPWAKTAHPEYLDEGFEVNVCTPCYSGHADCIPQHCIVHCPPDKRDPNNWRRLAQPLHPYRPGEIMELP